MDDYTDYWDKICVIYFVTKHYLLVGEEISEDFSTVLQPLKEHRDTFDHLARVYGVKFINGEIPDIKEYKISNMKKAVGHAYRAFFDTADFLTYVCRKKIREILAGKSREEILKVYPKYTDEREFLYRVPLEIAAIRENKDVGTDDSGLIRELKEYKAVIDHLLEIYVEVSNLFG